jgi:predicted KAP-like P-loop ATPase
LDDRTELTKYQNGDIVSLTQNSGLDKLLKPLTKEIHLFDTYVAGTFHLDDKTVLSEIEAGDRLTLRREDNKFDKKAILVLTSDGKKLGYVPRKDNVIFSRLMDAGKLLVAYIAEIDEVNANYTKIGIEIYLVDF